MIQMSIELPAQVEEQLRNLAARQKRDIGSLVGEAIRQYLEAEAITDLDAADVAEAQLALVGELRGVAPGRAAVGEGVRQSLHLASEEIVFEAKQPIHGRAEVSFHLAPNPRIVIEVQLSEKSEEFRISEKIHNREPIVICFPQRKLSAEVIITDFTISSSSIITAVPCSEPLVTGP